MLRSLKIGPRLVGGFAVLIIIMLAMVGTGLYGLNKTGGYMNQVVNEGIPRNEIAGDTLDKINIVARSSFGVLLLDNSKDVAKDLDRIAAAMKAVDENLKRYEKLIRTSEGRELFQKFVKAKEEFDPAIAQFSALMKAGDVAAAKKLRLEAIRAMQRERYMPAIDNLIKYEVKMTGQMNKDAAAARSSATMVMLVSAVVALFLSVVFAVLITLSITRPLRLADSVADQIAQGDVTVSVSDGHKDEVGRLFLSLGKMTERLRDMISEIKASADSVASASQQLSASSEEMSRGIDEQSNRSAQIATSTTEMSQTVMDIARNASAISNSALETTAVASEGSSIVEKSIQEVRDISTTVGQSAQLISSLGDRSKQIGEIVSVIKDIADQTNLLALNAAIEAARAGEQGRGFAVVADEVRKLAERTGKATAQIGEMIGAIQSEVDRAVTSMDQASSRVELGVEDVTRAGGALKRIVESVGSLQSMIQQVATATEEMSSVSETISSDIEAVANVASETASSSNQISQSSSDLARLSMTLQQIVSRFKV